MKKVVLSVIIMLSAFFNITDSKAANDVVDLEWNILGKLVVTVSPVTKLRHQKVSCTVKNISGAAIGGGDTYSAPGGVARVTIELPRKYQNDKQKILVTCGVSS